jgi:hypothetical protein
MSNGILEIFSNWDPEAEMTVKVKFLQKDTEAPVTGPEYTARLYDREIFTDDNYLGHASLNEAGEAHIHFFPANIKHLGLIQEKFPDLYILLFKGDLVHFQSKVWDNVDFKKQAAFSEKEGEVLDFGTYLVD